MNARVPIYEGDGLLHDALVRADRTARAAARTAAPAEEALDITRVDVHAIEREARAMRAEAIAGLFRKLWTAIERAMWRSQQRDLEAYLSKATDAADLERRMRALERAPHGDLVGSGR